MGSILKRLNKTSKSHGLIGERNYKESDLKCNNAYVAPTRNSTGMIKCLRLGLQSDHVHCKKELFKERSKKEVSQIIKKNCEWQLRRPKKSLGFFRSKTSSPNNYQLCDEKQGLNVVPHVNNDLIDSICSNPCYSKPKLFSRKAVSFTDECRDFEIHKIEVTKAKSDVILGREKNRSFKTNQHNSVFRMTENDLKKHRNNAKNNIIQHFRSDFPNKVEEKQSIVCANDNQIINSKRCENQSNTHSEVEMNINNNRNHTFNETLSQASETFLSKQQKLGRKAIVHLWKNAKISQPHNILERKQHNGPKNLFQFTRNFSDKRKSMSEEDYLHIQSHNDSLDMIVPSNWKPNFFNPCLELKIVSRMKVIALHRAENSKWKQSHDILIKVLECEKRVLGDDHPEVAETFYHIGVALKHLGDSEAAFFNFKQGLKILLPGRHNVTNMVLASILYHIALSHGDKNEFEPALYYLNISKQVETRILGNPTEDTTRLLSKFQCLCDEDTGILC